MVSLFALLLNCSLATFVGREQLCRYEGCICCSSRTQTSENGISDHLGSKNCAFLIARRK